MSTPLPFVASQASEPLGDPPARLAPPDWPTQWLSETYTRCKSQSHCANEFGVPWRFQVPDRRRSDKAPGRCLCQRYCKAPFQKNDRKSR